MTQVHATCISWRGAGILFLGPSASGKSDLALRLIRSGAELVADDRCILHAHDGHLLARPPAVIAGVMEVRGLGLLKLPYKQQAQLALAIDLTPHRGGVDRLPPEKSWEALGVSLPCWRLYPFDVTSEVKVDLALSIVRGEVEMQW